MKKKSLNDARGKDLQRQEVIRQFAESISVKEVPQQKGQSPYPRINRQAESENPSKLLAL